MALLDNARYVLRELSNTRSPKLEYNPASRQMLLLGVVRYPLDIACVAVGDDRHVGRVWFFFNRMKAGFLVVLGKWMLEIFLFFGIECISDVVPIEGLSGVRVVVGP
jgi:hypothetical protein